MKLRIIIPCLNEERTIGEVIDRIPKDIRGITSLEISVVDDGSGDATSAKASEKGAIVLRHTRNQGVGAAFRTGLEAAILGGADVILNMDGDGQFNPDDIPKLIGPILEGEADMVTASRFIEKKLEPEMPKIKLWGNKAIAFMLSQIMRQRFYDVSCGFRAYSREAALNLNLIGDFTYTHETLLNLAFKGFRIVEMPIKVKGERSYGTSRVAGSIPRYAKNSASIIFKSYRDYRPFWFFTLLGLCFFTVSASLLAFFFAYYFTTGRFSGHLWAGFSGGAFGFAGLVMLVVAVVSDMLSRVRQNQERILYHQRKYMFTRNEDQ